VVSWLENTAQAGYAHMTPAAFRQDLNAAGFTHGRNIAIEYHWAETQINRLQALALSCRPPR
jgi:putative tryptophan/tyrosine transport system substrate-binding protein